MYIWIYAIVKPYYNTHNIIFPAAESSGGATRARPFGDHNSGIKRSEDFQTCLEIVS